MSDDSGELEVSQQELGFDQQDPSDQEGQEEEGEQGDSPRGSRSPSPQADGANGEQQGGEDPDPMTPPKGVEAVGMAARTSARRPLSPISVICCKGCRGWSD